MAVNRGPWAAAETLAAFAGDGRSGGLAECQDGDLVVERRGHVTAVAYSRTGAVTAMADIETGDATCSRG